MMKIIGGQYRMEDGGQMRRIDDKRQRQIMGRAWGQKTLGDILQGEIQEVWMPGTEGGKESSKKWNLRGDWGC